MDEKPEPLWGVAELARFLRVPVTTIYQWRHHDYGPRGHRVGRYVRFDPAEVRAWFAAQNDGVV